MPENGTVKRSNVKVDQEVNMSLTSSMNASQGHKNVLICCSDS